MLSDLMMADLDGIGLLERTKEKFPDMPVVMVTAVHDISVALAAIRNGAYESGLIAVHWCLQMNAPVPAKVKAYRVRAVTRRTFEHVGGAHVAIRRDGVAGLC